LETAKSGEGSEKNKKDGEKSSLRVGTWHGTQKREEPPHQQRSQLKCKIGGEGEKGV